MRRSIVFITFAMILLLAACSNMNGKTAEVKIDYGNSLLYTHEEMDSAITEIKEQFSEFEGCELHSLTFAGDEKCASELSYCRSLRETEEITDCIVFHSSFRSPKNGGGSWESNKVYTWSWYLARTESGQWILLTYGY